MPAAIALFIVLSALAHADTLLRGDSSAWKGVDHQANAQRRGAPPVEYTLTTAPWFEHRADRKGGCDFQILARVNGRGPTRLILGDREMLLDDNWNPRARINGGETMTMEALFLDPVGGAPLAYRTTTFHCRAQDNRPAYAAADISGVR